MVAPLVISNSGVVHVESCVRLRNAGHPSKVHPWHGDNGVLSKAEHGLRACHTCLFPKETKTIKHLPCPQCRQKVAMPCVHTGVLTTIERRGRGTQRVYRYPERDAERRFLFSLLDSK